jgi:hypothetical protein
MITAIGCPPSQSPPSSSPTEPSSESIDSAFRIRAA